MTYTLSQAQKAHDEFFADAIKLMQAKRADYAGAADPFANFRQASLLGIAPSKGAMLRLLDKASRASRLLQNGGCGQVREESLRDTFIDLANYAAIVWMLHQEETMLMAMAVQS